ncbi:MAG: hypothetical protein NTZ73_02435 [Candidatus Diapherotrites archaeon]|nr:hypothetical protein [Candidatus Diapherotrites archaeon]
MKAFFSGRAQGTIEYIVMLAIIVVIALVVVSIIAGFSGSSQQITQNASAQYWMSSYPVAVLGAQMNIAPSGYEDANWGANCSSPMSFGLIIRNNGAEKITIDSITLAGGSAITSAHHEGGVGDWNDHLIKAVPGGANGTYLLDLTNRNSVIAPDIILQMGETAGVSLFNACSLTACVPGSAATMALTINYTSSNNLSNTQTGTKDLYINCVQSTGSAYADIFSPFSTSPA